MRLTQTLALAAVTLSSTALAQSDYPNASAPFNLVILSKNETINGSLLLACHEGAAIEGLCPSASLHLGSNGAATYAFNTTDANPGVNDTGLLTYLLVGGNFQVSEPMELSYNPTSNVAVPLFTPSDDEYTQVAFDAHGKMNIQGYVDDTKLPVAEGLKAYYRWYVCETYVGYAYTTLSWVMGNKQPENPSCQKVQVQRVFVK